MLRENGTGSKALLVLKILNTVGDPVFLTRFTIDKRGRNLLCCNVELSSITHVGIKCSACDDYMPHKLSHLTSPQICKGKGSASVR